MVLNAGYITGIAGQLVAAVDTTNAANLFRLALCIVNAKSALAFGLLDSIGRQEHGL